jgi:hypothetical protein
VLDIGGFLLALGAVARIVRFVTSDSLAAPFRDWAIRRFGTGRGARFVELIHCPWCLSVWAAAVVVPAAYAAAGAWWFVVPAAALSISYLVGLAGLAERRLT